VTSRITLPAGPPHLGQEEVGQQEPDDEEAEVPADNVQQPLADGHVVVFEGCSDRHKLGGPTSFPA
jgi:hypothetical protein